MGPIKLVLADVDGTLVTHEKVLTSRAIASVQALARANIAFAITSGRPPRGMQMFVEPLGLTTPLAAFNGGRFVRPDLSLVEQHVLGRDAVEPILAIIAAHQLDSWIYRGNDWFVRERHGPHVDREEWTVKFPPTVVPDFAGQMDEVVKVVGVSDDLEAVARCEADIVHQFSTRVLCKKTTSKRDQSAAVFAARSQPYYVDVTHPQANKGAVVLALGKMLGIDASKVATIGDMPNDISMFEKSGLSIAMGQSSEEVKRAATHVTTSSEEEGFANAIERFVVGQV
ncbi:MAG TPA: Cof-type HAD-IIB family hydrolase [Chthoniobacterales bacterium]|nr:Cof-type HAD-IIB family hydrolase [Chthoniobacterales bacterium]